MKNLSDCKEDIHSCSKCGLCQAVCPIYKITGNDCTVSRGHFIMLRGLIDGELKISKTINRYLDLCLKCNACSKFCPSGIDVVDIVVCAKAEFFKTNKIEKLKSKLLNSLLKQVKRINKIIPKHKSNSFSKKVIYFAGCSGVNVNAANSIIKLLNKMEIEVITPNFGCCGFPFYIKGDFDSFKNYMNDFYSVLDKYAEYDILTNCATCEKALKTYSKFSERIINVKNVFEYIRENNMELELKKPLKVTFHKPCNLDNFGDVKWVLENTKNLEYVVMQNYDKCCGLEGIFNFKERKILSKLFKEKHDNIKSTGAKIVLTSCLACKITLSLFSGFKYHIEDFAEFLAKNIK